MVRLSEITLAYGPRVLLEDASATFGRGEFVALLGRNGVGKSTLLRTIAGLTRPSKGKVFLDSHDIATFGHHEIAKSVAVVSTDKVRVQNLKVADAVALGRAPHTGWLGRLTAEDKQHISQALELTGLMDFASKTLDTLSDGERQRVMIARALAQQAPVIILDEPTAYLDLPARYEIFGLLRGLAHDENKAIICSTHDLDIAVGACDTLAMIHDERLHSGPVREMQCRVEEILRTRVL